MVLDRVLAVDLREAARHDGLTDPSWPTSL